MSGPSPTSHAVELGNRRFGPGHGLFLIAGPCVIESEALVMEIAERLCDLGARLCLPIIFKASFDKANRTSGAGFRGPGLDEGLAVLAKVRERFDLPVLTDVHESAQCEKAAQAVDVLQIPAFLCRQTDLLLAAGRCARAVNIKKGQFLAPDQLAPAVDKVRGAGATKVFVTERGVSFGYRALVTDMRAFPQLAATGCPVVFDGTHSVQEPGALGDRSGGRREYVPLLCRAAVAAGCDGLFLETHPDPDRALSDGPTMVPLAELEALLATCQAIHRLVREER